LIKPNAIPSSYKRVTRDELQEIQNSLIDKEKEDFKEKHAQQMEARAVEIEIRRRAKRIHFSQMTEANLKDFKLNNYSINVVSNRKEYVPFSEEKFKLLVKSAQDKQYYGKKSTGDYSNKHTYRG
jgi:hypothetical protein